MKNIEKMSDLEILNYVRDERKWMIEILNRKGDLEKKFNSNISDPDWEIFRYITGSHLNEWGEYAFEDFIKIIKTQIK